MRHTIATLFLISWLLVPGAHARSQLVLPYPSSFGQFQAATYDDSGTRLGDARFEIERLEGGRVRMMMSTEIEAGASNQASIVLAPLPKERGLRVIEQRSESRDPSGQSLGVLHVDHEKGVGRCIPADPEEPTRSMELPEQERIANVALNLLFSPMALGEARSADFDIFLCRGGPRVIAFSAASVPRVDADPTARIVEIRYEPNPGPALRWLAGNWLPQFSFWLDGDGNYLANRISLYTQGPEVLVVRDGISPRTLSPEH